MKKFLMLVGLSVALSACAMLDKESQLTQDWSAARLLEQAKDELSGGNYTRALKLYEILQARYPYGQFAEQAALDSAYAYYKDEDPVKALAEIERFMRTYPRHPRTDYALYLKGLVLFNEDKSTINQLAEQNWSERDPSANREAYAAFAELVKKYPESPYAADATKRLEGLVNALGGHELSVARYYMKRGAYLAAANRAQNVVRFYRNTPFVEEALAIMVAAYSHLQKLKLAEDAKRVLVSSFPDSVYATRSWQPQGAAWWHFSK